MGRLSRRNDPIAARRRTLGPVPDLERHLPSDWWRHLFNSVYLMTDGDVVENDENTVKEIEATIAAAHLEPNDRILDLCCGQGRHSLELARRGFKNVTGVDRSRYLVRLARRRAKNLQLDVRFREGDARKFRHRGELFHTVLILGNSFGYFDMESDDAAVLEAIKRATASNGTLVLDLTDGEWVRQNYQPRSWEWIDEEHLVCRERALSTDGDRLIAREVVVHAERGVIADQFYAERLYSIDRITRLLESHDFSNVRNHGVLEAGSERGQDLGMMAHRLFLTVRAPKREVAVPAVKAVKQIAVLLGDPKLPDEVKRDGQYNPEDIETTQRLKDALSELDGYQFEYLDDHDTLLSTLRREPPEFILNLCDEGFNNDALKELHIPALLEILEIPYSGAGPSCLGLCYDKSQVRAIAQSLDIPVPLESYCGPDDISATLPSSFPALVKPNRGDGSFGITKDAVVSNTSELVAYLEWLRDTYGRREVLVQEYLNGNEYSVGLIGNPGIDWHMLPPLEVDYSKLDEGLPQILSYESKWIPDSPYWNKIQYREAGTDSETQRKMFDYACLLFERLGCRDYARFDFRCDANGTLKLLEVNPNPGWPWDGKMNFMAGFAGMRYADLLRMILEASLERYSVTKSIQQLAIQEAEPIGV